MMNQPTLTQTLTFPHQNINLFILVFSFHIPQVFMWLWKGQPNSKDNFWSAKTTWASPSDEKLRGLQNRHPWENGDNHQQFLTEKTHWFPNALVSQWMEPWRGGEWIFSLNQNHHVHVEDSFQIKQLTQIPKSSLKPPLEHQSLLTSSCDCCFDGSSQNSQVLSKHGHCFRPRRIGLPHVVPLPNAIHKGYILTTYPNTHCMVYFPTFGLL